MICEDEVTEELLRFNMLKAASKIINHLLVMLANLRC